MWAAAGGWLEQRPQRGMWERKPEMAWDQAHVVPRRIAKN